MDEWKQEYIDEVNKNKIPENLINDTLQKIELKANKQNAKKYSIVGNKAAIIACSIIGLLILVPTISYAAYGVNILDLLANRNKEVKSGGGVSIGIPTNTTTYVYDGEELEVPYKLTGSGAASVSGMLLLIDGISQPYRIKMNGKIMSTEDEYMHVFDITDTGKADFSFIITPVKGKKGEKLTLNFVQVNDPEYQPEDETYVGYDFSGMSFSSNPVAIEFMEDSSNKTEIAAYEGPWTLDVRKDNVLSGETDTGYFVAKGGMVDIAVSIYGEKEGKYRTALYINNKPVKIESMDYLECIVELGESSTCEFSIDISDYDRINTVYVITTLVEDASGDKTLEYSRKTSSQVMINDLKAANYAEEDTAARDNILNNIKEGGSELKELTKRLPDINWHVETMYLGDGIYMYLDNSSKVCKYDIYKNEIIKASEATVKATDRIELYDLADGYAIKHETILEDEVKIVFYNEDLVETKIVDVSKLLERDESTKRDSVSLSWDGRYLSYVDFNREVGYTALYTYNLEKNEKKQIYILYNQSEGIKGSIFIYSFQFSKDNKRLYYVGSKCMTEEKQVNGIGTVGIDGENMTFYEANVDQDFLLSNQYAMFYEGVGAKYNKGSEFLVTIDNKGILSGYQLEGKNESKLAFVSEEGNIFVTVEETDLSTNPPYILRAYNAKTGKLLMEEKTNFEDYDISRIKQMIIMEDDNAFVVYYRLLTKVVGEEDSYIEEGKAMIYNY